MLKYNDQGLQVGEIKQLLGSFNLPQCPVWSEAESYSDGEHYLRGNELYEVSGGVASAVCTYKFGDAIPNITKNLEIRSLLYDSYTHTYLGDYLRFLRDYAGVDLMPLYNCFTNELVSNLKFDIINGKHSFYSSNSRTKIYMVPVKFGKTYTIGMDCNETVCMFCGCYSSNRYIPLDSSGGFENKSFRRASGLRFNHPFVFGVPSCPSGKRQFEGCLKLFMEVPATSKSSIAVLEGDFTNNCEYVLNPIGSQTFGRRLIEHLDPNGNVVGNYEYLFKPQLLGINTKEVDLVSDRLVEYLTGAVVSPLDSETADIAFLQDKMSKGDMLRGSGGRSGIWDDGIRKGLYAFATDSGLIDRKKDILSYCDKDVEAKLGGIYSDSARKAWKV